MHAVCGKRKTDLLLNLDMLVVVSSFRMPVLYSSIEQDGLGRFFCCLFFFTLTLAGISSLIAMFELGVQSLNDFGSESDSMLLLQLQVHVYWVRLLGVVKPLTF